MWSGAPHVIPTCVLSYVIPNTERSGVEGSPCKGKRAGGFLFPLTSPRWGSCAASSKCSCEQAFLLASDGMTDKGWGLTVSCPPCVREGAERSEAGGL